MPFDGTNGGDCPVAHFVSAVKNFPLCTYASLVTEVEEVHCPQCGSGLAVDHPLEVRFSNFGEEGRTYYLCRSKDTARQLSAEHQEHCDIGPGALTEFEEICGCFKVVGWNLDAVNLIGDACITSWICVLHI